MEYGLDYWIANKYKLLTMYQKLGKKHEKILYVLTKKLELILANSGCNAQIKGRIKSFDAFYRKLLSRCQNQIIEKPLDAITDIIGIRLVVPFLDDLDRLEKLVMDNFEIVETEHKKRELNIREFGYDSIHIQVLLPDDVIAKAKAHDKMQVEVQLRTILQDAWAEVEHELIYKTSIDKVEDTIRRKMIAVNATLSLGDTIFQEIRDYQRKRYKDIQERHKKLMDKVSTIPEKMEKLREHPAINVIPAETDHGSSDADTEVEKPDISTVKEKYGLNNCS